MSALACPVEVQLGGTQPELLACPQLNMGSISVLEELDGSGLNSIAKSLSTAWQAQETSIPTHQEVTDGNWFTKIRPEG